MRQVRRVNWEEIRELRLVAEDRLKQKVDGRDEILNLGGTWKGDHPEFRNLLWVAK